MFCPRPDAFLLLRLHIVGRLSLLLLPPPSVHVSSALLWPNHRWSACFSLKKKKRGEKPEISELWLMGHHYTLVRSVRTIFQGKKIILPYLLCCFIRCCWRQRKKNKKNAGTWGAISRAVCQRQLRAGIAAKPWPISFSFFESGSLVTVMLFDCLCHNLGNLLLFFSLPAGATTEKNDHSNASKSIKNDHGFIYSGIVKS